MMAPSFKIIQCFCGANHVMIRDVQGDQELTNPLEISYIAMVIHGSSMAHLVR